MPTELQTPATAEDAPIGLWDIYDAWLQRASAVISDSADALDAMNVFPISDSDTGSNLRLTLAGIVRAVPEVNADSHDALIQAAILSAHGNSGAILAEMFASVARALQSEGPSLRALGPGELVAHLLRTVAVAATRAVARPVAGTILSVADASADAAEQALVDHRDDARGVATAAQQGAHRALARTPDQLEVLAAAGVVDAGGQAYVLLVDALVEVLGGPAAEPLPAPLEVAPRPVTATAGRGESEFEVMYALRDADPDALDRLRQELSVLGHSVVVVGDQAVAQVHVHLADAGAAVEAGLAYGRPSRIRITTLPASAVPTADRVIIAVVAGPGLVEAVRAHGGVAVLPAGREVTPEELVAAAAGSCRDLVLLPNDMASLEIVLHQATEWRRQGRRVAVIPTTAQVQGLAAMAVHEPTADFDSAVVAMTGAAAHARHGAVTVAENSAMTMAGRCEVGDVLGLVDGDFVEIGSSALDIADAVVDRLLAFGGELVTVVRGADADDALVDGLADRIDTRRPAVDVEVIDGRQGRYLLLIGVE